LSLRIPLTPDQTLQTEFHEIERRLRKLEKTTGVTPGGSVRIVTSGGSSGTTVNLQPIYDRLNDLESAIANLPEPVNNDFGGVGPSSVHGLVPAPGVPQPPTGEAGHVLLEDGSWGFPFRGLISVATSGEQTSPPYDIVDVTAALQAQTISAGDTNVANLYTHGVVQYIDSFWDDLRFPAQGINPAGAPAPPGVDTATGCLSFAGNLDNVIGGVAQLPHSWKAGTRIHPHLHLLFTTSNPGTNTRWQFMYNRADRNEDFEHAAGTFTSMTAVTIPNPGNALRHVHLIDLGELDMTTYRESCIILWQVWRLAASDAADNDTNDCLLMEFDIHYEIDKPGSVDEAV
jgi:hypothetical protein